MSHRTRTEIRRHLPDTNRIERLEEDGDKFDAAILQMAQSFNRLTWTILASTITLAGSIAIWALTTVAN